MKKIILIIFLCLLGLFLWKINFISAENLHNKTQKNFIMQVIGDHHSNTYYKEDFPNPLPKYGKVLCLENKNRISSRIVKGEIYFKEAFHYGENQGYQEKILGCKNNETPLFFISDNPRKLVKEGKVITITTENDNNIGFNKLKLILKNKEYNIHLDKSVDKKKQTWKYAINLSSNKVKQKLISRTLPDVYQNIEINNQDGNPSLFWAGNIDNDNKVDLIIGYTDGDYIGAHSLFLSSYAKNDNLVKEVAKFKYISGD